jgi:trehalose 6-phosphate synthase
MLAQLDTRPQIDSRSGVSTGRLIIVSNRGAVEHYIDDLGVLRQRPTGGGVAIALSSIAANEPLTWIAAAGGFADRFVSMTKGRVPLGSESELRLLNLPEEVYAPYYESFCNPLLWFVQHSIASQLSGHDLEAQSINSWRQGYIPANRLFASAVIEEMGAESPGGRVMLHDYHLYLAPRLIRAARPQAALQHFVHIPWPAAPVWQALPMRIVGDICDGLLGNDSVVFQTEESVENFLDTCRVYLGSDADVCFRRGEIRYAGRKTVAWANPISVDIDELRALGESAKVQRYKAGLASGTDEKFIVRVDRLDPSKNVIRGFEAFETLLRRRPQLRGRVRFLAFLVPTRSGIREYDAYTRATFETADRINSQYGTADWQPINVYHEQNRAQALAGLMLYDVLLVNSIADGMNLVSKEGPVLNETDGVLVLSRAAGSFEQLRAGSICVDPVDVCATAAALETALSMSEKERRERATLNRHAISNHGLQDWLRMQLKDLSVSEYVACLSDPLNRASDADMNLSSTPQVAASARGRA